MSDKDVTAHIPHSGYFGPLTPTVPAPVSYAPAVVIQPPTEPTSSIELSENSKGAVQVTVKAYGTDLDATAEHAMRIYRMLRGKIDGAEAGVEALPDFVS